MPPRLIEFVPAAITQAQHQWGDLTQRFMYNPAMANQVGNSNYLMTRDNLPRRQSFKGQKLNVLA